MPSSLGAGAFIGRRRELDELQAALEDALAGRGRLVLLAGEPGIGKTRTAQELAARAAVRGALVLWGRCYEEAGAPPYWPWVQVVRAYLGERDVEALRAALGSGAPHVAEIVPELRQRLPDIEPALNPADPDQARFRLFDAVAAFLKSASHTQPLVVVLDNLHWADKPSLLLLEFLARETGGSRLAVVGTYRDMEVERRHPLADTLGELTREGLLHRVPLRGLALEDVHRFVEAAAGPSPPLWLVSALHAQTEGNPLFLTEIVRLLLQEGELAPERLAQTRAVSVSVPQGVREVIGRRLNCLAEHCVQVLVTASVIGREFRLNELAHLVGATSEERLLEVLEEAIAARILEETPHVPGRYQFTHVLIRETLHDELSGARRARLHLRIGEALEGLHDQDRVRHLARLAHHFFEAAHIGGADKALTYALQAAERAKAVLAYEEEARYCEMALQVLESGEPVDDVRRCRVLLSLGEAHRKAGESTAAMGAFQRAADSARTLGLREELALAAIGFEDTTWRPGLYGGPAVRLLEEAVEALDQEDSHTRARALAGLARALQFSGLQERASSVGQQALEVARRLNDPAALAAILSIVAFSRRRPEELEARLSGAAEAMRIARERGDTDRAMEINSWYLFDLMEVGDIAAARAELAAYEQTAHQLRQPFYRYVAASCRAALAIADGRFDEAEELVHGALAIGQRIRGLDASGVFGMHLFTLRREQGRLKEVAPTLSAIVQRQGDAGVWRPGLALIYAEREFEHLAAKDFADLPLDAVWVVCLAYLAEVCAFLGDARRAQTLYSLLLPYDGHNVVIGGGVAYLGAAARFLGVLGATLSRWDVAQAHFESALDLDTRSGAWTWLAHTQHEYARMLLARPRPGGEARAGALLEEALATARRLGMRSLEERVLALRREAPRSPGRGQTFPDGLTGREVEVLRLIAAGRSNRDIAEELVISPNTVANHVKSVLSKTGAANRAEAAAYAIRRGLV